MLLTYVFLLNYLWIYIRINMEVNKMLQQVEYNRIIRSIDRLDYLDKTKLLHHLKKAIDSNKKRKITPFNQKTSWLGCLSDQTQIRGDIIAPVLDEAEWEVLSTLYNNA